MVTMTGHRATTLYLRGERAGAGVHLHAIMKQDGQTLRVLTIEEAAERLRMHPRSVYRMCAAGRLDAFQTVEGAGPWRIRIDADGLPRLRVVPKLMG